MSPDPGERQVGFVGDRLAFELRDESGVLALEQCAAFLRTTIGSGAILNDETVRAFETSVPVSHAAWRDLPMERMVAGFRLSVVLSEPGFYRAKAYLIDAQGFQHWPEGDDFGVSVHPSDYRTANLIYCAWPRLLGASKESAQFLDEKAEKRLRMLDRKGYSVIPPSGTLRDLKQLLGHIVKELGCRIVHLLPVNPTPTTFARFGRYGSPYAALDLTAIDPALVEFDRRTTGVQQFCELTREAHRMKARVFLDLVINHTGWGSRLQEVYPEWFRRHEDGRFANPGAWGTVWEDLVELEHHDPVLGQELAEVFLTWSRRGVDGFRCDAGYMVPLPLWRYITARVRREFPNTIFLLEGLGGGWEVTEQLLMEGGMQWAYSELFQNYSGKQVSWYLDYVLRQSQRVGRYLHYSETHDNPRLAAKGMAWSLLRNRLCGLTSVSGGFGFTCGVEWLATEKIVVHQRTGLNWGGERNIVKELSQLTRVLADHPCFFDGAQLSRLSKSGSTVFVLERVSQDGNDRVLVLVNTDVEASATLVMSGADWEAGGAPTMDLLQQPFPEVERQGDGSVRLKLRAGAAHCLGGSMESKGLAGPEYRRRRGIRAWLVQMIQAVWPEGLLGDFDVEALVVLVAQEPLRFLAAVRHFRTTSAVCPWQAVAERGGFPEVYPTVVLWESLDERRIVPVPPNHWLVFRNDTPFEVRLRSADNQPPLCLAAVALTDGVHLACVDASQRAPGLARVEFRSLENPAETLNGEVLFLPAAPEVTDLLSLTEDGEGHVVESPVVLLTNRRGGMSRLGVDFGQVKSKYDCLLGANFHAKVPVDRHVLAKRARIWVSAGGLITALSRDNLVSFSAGPPARWRYLVCAGSGQWVPLEVTVDMVDDRNMVLVRCERMRCRDLRFEDIERVYGRSNAMRAKMLDPKVIDLISVSVTVRVDVEDRNFHWETQWNEDSERHFSNHISSLEDGVGFIFRPAPERLLEVRCDRGRFHAKPEWSHGMEHPVEASRGQTGQGDAYSPGWFDVPLGSGDMAHFIVSAEPEGESLAEVAGWFERRKCRVAQLVRQAGIQVGDRFGEQLVKAVSAFVVKRDDGMTVIAGYPWFLDWGRDSLICARGLLACGYEKEVVKLLQVFGRFEESGTLPNSLHGEDTSNRDTSDAPLWYGLVCADLVAQHGVAFLKTPLGCSARGGLTEGKSGGHPKTIGEVLRRTALGYLNGTPNGICVDADSGLVWSPSHFTWMDTNHPPGTPREGYPIEIQVLWILLLRLLEETEAPSESQSWRILAAQVTASFEKYYWLAEAGYYADLIVAKPGVAAAEGIVDSALRSNFLLAISSGLVRGPQARRAVDSALRYLMVPGGVRSLAPLLVTVPLAVYSCGGQLLNDPRFPYWGRYEGDEDTRRKPAYHNGTAWTWSLGILCEALLRAWDFSPESVASVRAYLGATGHLMQRGCIGQIPEVMDGDAPHVQRGCDAQAWGVTEAIRVWKLVS